MPVRIPKHRKYPLRNIHIDIKWVIDSSIAGCVNGEKGRYTIWVHLSNDVEDIRDTIIHELAHIHAYEYFRKVLGDKVFYSHAQLHRDLMAHYAEKWSDEVDMLYEALQFADVDIVACDEMELQDIVRKYAHYVRNKHKKEAVPA